MKAKIELEVEQINLLKDQLYILQNYIPGTLYLVNNEYLVLAGDPEGTSVLNVFPLRGKINAESIHSISSGNILLREEFVLKLIAITQNKERFKELK